MTRARRLPVLSLVVAALTFAAPARAQTTIIDFEAFACSGPAFIAHSGPVISNGFSFGPIGGFFASPCSGNSSFPGSTTLLNNVIGGFTTLTKVGNGPFALNSISLASLFAQTPGQTITFTGMLGNSTQVFQSFILGAAPGNPALSQFQFGHAFSNVVSVTWQQNTPFHQFDDVTLSSVQVVPEPVTVALLATGLTGIGVMGLVRRRRRV